MPNLYAGIAPHLLALIEFILMVAAGALILRRSPNPLKRNQTTGFLKLERAFARLATRKRLCVLLVGFSVISIRTALIPIIGIPQPRYDDEFSYLLAGDTFAHGRLTNPTHPMWIHFESFHIIERPTYMSMYPPAQGVVLAAGQVLGHPWTGQILITALMCSALCWMLQTWLPPSWALLGAVLVVLRLGLLSYWMNTYWGTSVAAFAGALVLGAWPRLRRRIRIRDSLLMGLGFVILANSRPYEGFVFGIPIALAMLWWLAGRQRPSLPISFYRLILPLLAVLICGAVATSYYYYRVTGDPFRMAYQVNRETYAMAPYFIWQKPRPEPVYRHAVMRDFYYRELADFEKSHTFRGYLSRALAKAYSWWQFFLEPLLTVPLIALPWVARRKKMMLPVAICAAMIAGFSLEIWMLPHYFAPATGALYILLVQCMRQLWHWRTRNNGMLGLSIVRAIPVLAFTMILLRVTAAATHVQIEPVWPRGNRTRAEIESELRQMPGQQMVLVRYGPSHDLDLEWVWNDADIDRSKVVWARDMGDTANQELLNYFKDRRVWRINGDDLPARLEP
jgi:hypothetical protein